MYVWQASNLKWYDSSFQKKLKTALNVATIRTGLLFNMWHLSWYDNLLISSSGKLILFSFLVIEINLFHLRSSEDKIIKNVGQPNCFTIAKISDKNFFHQFMNANVLSFAMKSLSYQSYCWTYLQSTDLEQPIL